MAGGLWTLVTRHKHSKTSSRRRRNPTRAPLTENKDIEAQNPCCTVEELGIEFDKWHAQWATTRYRDSLRKVFEGESVQSTLHSEGVEEVEGKENGSSGELTGTSGNERVREGHIHKAIMLGLGSMSSSKAVGLRRRRIWQLCFFLEVVDLVSPPVSKEQPQRPKIELYAYDPKFNTVDEAFLHSKGITTTPNAAAKTDSKTLLFSAYMPWEDFFAEVPISAPKPSQVEKIPREAVDARKKGQGAPGDAETEDENRRENEHDHEHEHETGEENTTSETGQAFVPAIYIGPDYSLGLDLRSDTSAPSASGGRRGKKPQGQETRPVEAVEEKGRSGDEEEEQRLRKPQAAQKARCLKQGRRILQVIDNDYPDQALNVLEIFLGV